MENNYVDDSDIISQDDDVPTVKKGMDEDSFNTFVGNEIRDALGYIDSEIAPERELNYNYFMGKMDDVPPVPNRSAVVVRVVSDYIGFMLPSLLRTMISGKKVIEYRAKGKADAQAAREATAFVNEVVLRMDNQIENECYGWGFDALVNKVGVLKVWWEEEKEHDDAVFGGLDPNQLAMAANEIQQRGGEIIEADQAEDGSITIKVRKTTDKSHVKFAVLPPEEFVISRDAREGQIPRLKTHRTYRYVGDLLEAGYDYDTVMRLPSYTEAQFNNESQNRQPAANQFNTNTSDPMLKKVAVHEGVVYCDKDGTGLKEWFIVAGGWNTHIEVLECKPFEDDVFFAPFCPIPYPHLFYGGCPADDLIELQRIETVLARQIQDNVYLTNAPQREVLVSALIGNDLSFVQNMAPGGIIPVTRMGAVNPIVTPFMGEASLGLLRYWDTQAENRTGVGRNSLGLDPEVLQNQSATAANIQKSASSLKMETIARIWAAGGMRKLGVAILCLLKRNQSFERMIMMNGEEKQIDPSTWESLEDWDVVVNTGLGTGDRSRDVAALSGVIAKMEQVIQIAGPDNPIVTVPMMANALQELAEASGLANPDKYFTSLPPDWQMPKQEEPEDPEMAKAKAQMALEEQKAKMQFALKQEEAKIDAELQRQKAALQAEIEGVQAQADMATARQKAELDMELARTKAQLDAEMKRYDHEVLAAIKVRQARKPKAQSAEQ